MSKIFKEYDKIISYILNFLQINEIILNNFIDYNEIKNYLFNNTIKVKLNYIYDSKNQNINDKDISILFLTNQEIAKEYQYIRTYYRKLRRCILIIQLKENNQYKTSNKEIKKSILEGKYNLIISNLENKMKELYLLQKYIVLDLIKYQSEKQMWLSFENNFSFYDFYWYVKEHPFYFNNSPKDYFKQVKNIYKKIFITRFINNENELRKSNVDNTTNSFINEEYYDDITELFPQYFYTFNDEPEQEEFIKILDVSKRYTDEQKLFFEITNEVKKVENKQTKLIFYKYFIDNKIKILLALKTLIDRYLIIQDHPEIQKQKKFYEDFFLRLNKNYSNLTDISPDIDDVREYFSNTQDFITFFTMVFALSPIKSFNLIDDKPYYEAETSELTRKSTLSFQVNGINSQKEYCEKIYNNILAFYRLLVEEDKYLKNGIPANAELIILLNLVKVNRAINTSYNIELPIYFNSKEDLKEKVKSELMKILFEIEEMITFYTSELEKLGDLFDISLNINIFSISYQLRKKGDGLKNILKNGFLFPIKENEPTNPFKCNGWIWNPNNKDKLCFCHCMETLGFKNIVKIMYSKGLKPKKNGVSLSDINFLCSTIDNLFIRVFDEELNKFHYFPNNLILNDEEYKYNLILMLENHYVVFSKEKPTGKDTRTKELKTKFVFFDIETITTSTHKTLKVLSNFFFTINEEDFYNFDIDNENKKKFYEKNYKFDTNVNYLYTNQNNPLLPMLNYLIKLSDKYKIVLIGYNASGFDLFFVMDCLKYILQLNFEIRKNISIFYVKNRIYNIKYKNLSTFDPYLHLRMSLYDACIAFKTNPVKQLDLGKDILEKLQIAYENNTLYTLFDEVKDQLFIYNRDDVLCLVSLVKNYQYLVSQEIEDSPFKNFKVWEYMTLPSMINKYLQTFIYPKPTKQNLLGKNIVKPYTRDDYLTFKSYQKAGLVSIFGDIPYSKKVFNCHLLDICSQYPYVCLNKLFPSGDYTFNTFPKINFSDDKKIVDNQIQLYKEQKIPTPDLTKLGIYMCKINTYNLPIPIVGKRNKNKTNNWQHQKNKMYNAPLTTPEIKWLIKVGCYVEILEGFEFENKTKPFNDFMEPIAVVKMKMDKIKDKMDKNLPITDEEKNFYDPVLRTLIKLILNATTGACNQRLHETETFLKDDGYLEVINLKINPNIPLLEQKYLTKTVSRPYLGNYIYAYSRLIIVKTAYEIELNNPYKFINPFVIYGDTDSLLITNEGYNIWKNNEKINWRLQNEDEKIGIFGYFKYEGFFEENILIDKKIYVLYNKNNCYPKCKCPLKIFKKGECLNGNKYRSKGFGVGVNLDVKNGYYIIPIKENKNVLSENIKKYLDKECEYKTMLYIKNDLNIPICEENKNLIIEKYEQNYYKIMRRIETEYFNEQNKITNMRDIELYNYLLNGYQLKVIRHNMLLRDKKDYSIKQITKELIISPNTEEYEELKNLYKKRKEVNKTTKKISEHLNKCLTL